MSKDVCCVIVTHNRINMLKECINAVKSQTYKCDILVINNCSTDNTDQFLNENNIFHISNINNIGGAGGFNIGIKTAVSNNYKYLWLMDDDCLPKQDALENLLMANKRINCEYGFLASKVLWTDGSLNNMNKVKIISELTENIYYIKQATFVSIFIPSETIKKVGLPIKEFFIWGDDIEFTRRVAVRNKINSFYVDNSIVFHRTETNLGSKIAFDCPSRIERYIYAYKNEHFLYRKEGIKGLTYYFAKVFYNLIRIILLSPNNKIIRIKTLLTGVKQGFSFNPLIEYV